MGFKDLKNALYESNLNLKKPPKEPVELDEEIEQIYQDDTPWVDHLLRVQENFVILGEHSGKPIMQTPKGATIGVGFKAQKLHKTVKEYCIITPPNPIKNVSFVHVEFLDGSRSVLALSDKAIVKMIEEKFNENDSLGISEDDTEKLRLLIKGYNYMLQF